VGSLPVFSEDGVAPQHDAHDVLCPKKSLKISKGIIRSRKLKDRQHTGKRQKRKSSKGQTMIYESQNGKLKIEQHEPH
jgi:hypothetical protein